MTTLIPAEKFRELEASVKRDGGGHIILECPADPLSIERRVERYYRRPPQ